MVGFRVFRVIFGVLMLKDYKASQLFAVSILRSVHAGQTAQSTS